MTVKILVAYDGTLNSKTALNYGMKRVKDSGGELMLLHLFDPSLFVDYDAGPRAIERAKAESNAMLCEAKGILDEAGIRAFILSAEGEPISSLLERAENWKADLILCPPKYKAVIADAPCPVSLIPGNILVPIDGTEGSVSAVNKAAEEAKATGSRVVLLGVIPVHMYGALERIELESVKKRTVLGINEAQKALKDAGVKTEEVMLAGYPDEEILEAAKKYDASMIIVPTGTDAPSEAGKAGSIITEEEGLKSPVVFATA